MHLRTDTSAQSHFARVPNVAKPRNTFGIAKKHVSTCGFDILYPVYKQKVEPGDSLQLTLQVMARLQTQGWILYDDLYFDLQAWYVPNRLVQTNFARYMFNFQEDPTQDNSSLTSPKLMVKDGMSAVTLAAKSLYDYFGDYPIGEPLSYDPGGGDPWVETFINNYDARAYYLIWNWNYRDQNLQDSLVIPMDEGPDDPTDFVLQPRGKRHDKFTSCLPFQQKGQAAVIPLSGLAPVDFSGASNSADAWFTDIMHDANVSLGHLVATGGGANQVLEYSAAVLGSDDQAYVGTSDGSILENWLKNTGSVFADLSTAGDFTVNDLRNSVAVQHLLEADARGGTRDIEAIQHRWGVTVPDFRLSQPEFIGSQTFSFDGVVVPQTSETASTPQGTLVQFSQARSGFSVSHSFPEHGVFMILLSLRSNQTYQNFLSRMNSHRTRLDWYNPEFANLGEVALLNQEQFYKGGAPATPEQAMTAQFGFQEFGYWLRYEDSIVTAEMRSNYATSLDMKHMAYDFGTSVPVLNDDYIKSATPIGRNIVVQPEVADPVELNMLATGRIARVLPMYSVPGLLRL